MTSTVPPTFEAGFKKLMLVPSADSVQDEADRFPTEIEVTPTKNEPVKVTVEFPVLGIRVLFEDEIRGACVSIVPQVSDTDSALLSCLSPNLLSPIENSRPSDVMAYKRPHMLYDV
jgi:hypothetical protein